MPSWTSLEKYEDKYRIARLTRTPDGILTVRLHTDDGPLQWGVDDDDETDLADLFADIGHDPENRAMIFTGTGSSFIAQSVRGHSSRYHSPATFEDSFHFQRRLHANLLGIEVPIVAAINGPALIHSELALMSDIVLASEDTVFQDKPHFPAGIPPGDGVQLVYTALLGPTRAKYFLLTGQTITAREALNLGLVNEVLPADALIPRARTLAELVVERPPLTVRYTRRVMNAPMRRSFENEYDHGLALEALAIVQLRGWRQQFGGQPPTWDRPTFDEGGLVS
jgi:enoyl-CoA hydratase/carnithine racemase